MRALRHLVLFVAVVALVVSGASAAATLGTDRGGYVPASAPQFHSDAALAADGPESGTVTMESDAADGTVLVDVAHDNDVSATDLRPLVSALVRNGHEVRFYRGESASLEASLRRADAFVVVNPRRGYGSSEVDAVRSFVRDGGRLLLLGDPSAASSDSRGYRNADLASGVGVAFEGGYLYDMANNDNNFKSVYASPDGDDPLTDGVDRLVFQEASPVASGGTDVLVTDETARRSTTRRSGACPVAVRRGNVVAVGDSDFVTAEHVSDADNEVFVGNLADFLVNGDAT